MLGSMLVDLGAVDEWLDECVSEQYKQQPLAYHWARISKIGEEYGEAVDAFILYTGANPRKEQTDSLDDTLSELADTAITAILAMIHLTKDVSQVGGLLLDKTQAIVRRMVDHKVKARQRTVTPSLRATDARDEWLSTLPKR